MKRLQINILNAEYNIRSFACLLGEKMKWGNLFVVIIT